MSTTESDEKVRDLERQVQKLKDRLELQEMEAHSLYETSEVLSKENEALDVKLSHFETEAIIIVPQGSETLTETLRRRIRTLEGRVEKLEGEHSEPSLLQKRRIALELQNKKLFRTISDVASAAHSSAALTFIRELCQGVLREGPSTGSPQESKESVFVWTTDAANFLETMMRRSPHEKDCACEACFAFDLLERAGPLGIEWSKRDWMAEPTLNMEPK